MGFKTRILLVGLGVAGCQFPEDDGSGNGLENVVVDGWKLELAARLDPDDPNAAQELRIGGREFETNFANRGDIIIEFWDQPEVTVEFRRFATVLAATSPEFEKLGLWAFDTAGDAPLRPDEMVISKPCIRDDGALRDGCAIRAMYDGISQPVRLGTDIRVTLPRTWTGNVRAFTEDNSFDNELPDRGDICVGAGAASVEADLEHGRALIQTGASEGREISVVGEAANITIDVPADVESRLSANHASVPEEGKLCNSEFNVDGFVLDDGGAPGGALIGTAGPRPFSNTVVRATAKTSSCDLINALQGARRGAFGEHDVVEGELRGNITYCNGCLAAASCSDLIP